MIDDVNNVFTSVLLGDALHIFNLRHLATEYYAQVLILDTYTNGNFALTLFRDKTVGGYGIMVEQGDYVTQLEVFESRNQSVKQFDICKRLLETT